MLHNSPELTGKYVCELTTSNPQYFPAGSRQYVTANVGTSVTTSNKEKEKTVGVCAICDEILPVWIFSDGTIQPISSYNACSCQNPSPKILDGDAVYEGTQADSKPHSENPT